MYAVSGISVFAWTGENDSKTLRVDADFFDNGGKKIVFKRKRIRVDGTLNQPSPSPTLPILMAICADSTISV